jgi:DNA-binding response OmpR family regulator
MQKKIVVIDDEEDVLKITRAALVTRNYDVYTFTSGETALEYVEEDRPDLIICDLMMPRVSGLEVLKRLRRDPEKAKIPVMVLSALGNDDRPPEFWVRTLGVDDYVQKPFDPLDLLGRVEYLFRRKSYISAREGGGLTPAGEGAAKADRPVRDQDDATVSPIDVRSITPAEVVKIFVESYNRQDFATEYQCLAEEMIGQFSLHDYVERRRQTYVEEKQTGRTQRVAGVDEEKISLNVAKVVINREDQIGGTTKERKEVFTLKKTHKGWKIIGYKPQKPK